MKSYSPSRKTILIGAQTPKGNNRPGVPFGIVSPTFVPVKPIRNIPVKPKQTQGIETLLLGAGLILTAYALFKM